MAASSAAPSATPTSSTSISTASSIAAPRSNHRKPMVSSSVSTVPSWTSSSASRCVKPSTRRSRRCRPISTPGLSTTTPSARIWATEIRADGPSKPSCHALDKTLNGTAHMVSVVGQPDIHQCLQQSLSGTLFGPAAKAAHNRVLFTLALMYTTPRTNGAHHK